MWYFFFTVADAHRTRLFASAAFSEVFMRWSGSRRALLQALILGTAIAVSMAGLPITSTAATPSRAAVSAAPALAPGQDAANDSDGDGTLDRPDAVSAAATARAEDRRVEDLSQRTKTESIYANPDGTWTGEATPEPTRVQDEAGEWHDIDTALVAKDGGLAPKFADTDVVFSDGGDRSLATMTEAGRDLGWRWPEVLPAPTIEGNTATYADVIPSGDLVVRALGTGFTHSIVLSEAPTAPLDLVLPIRTDGGEIVEDADGSLSVETAAGKDLVAAPQPVMYDASGLDPAGDPSGQVDDSAETDGGAMPEPVMAPVDAVVGEMANGTPKVTLSPDQEFLTDRATVYPVTVDPSWTTYSTHDTYIASQNSTTSQVSSINLRVGTTDGGGIVRRTYMQFGFAPGRDKDVTSATLSLYNWNSGSCTAGSVVVQKLTEAWSPTGITWGDQPAATATGQTSYSPAHGVSGSCANAYATWDVTTTVRAWSANPATNYGVRLRAATETSNNAYRSYASMNNDVNGPDYAKRPRISYTYNSYPGAAITPTISSSRTYAGVNYVGESTPSWTTSATDPDSGTLTYTTEARTSKTAPTATATCTTTTVASGATASCAPSSALSNNTTYFVRSRANDAAGLAGAWSAWREIKTDLATPTVPTLSCTGVADKHWYETRPASSATCTVTSNGSDLEYQLNGQTQPARTPNTTFSVDIPTSGYTNVEVRSRTRTGAVSEWARVGFGTGPASLLSPIANDRSSSTFPVEAAAPVGADSARVQWRFAPDTTGTPDPEAGWTDADDVKNASTGTAWTGNVSGTDWSMTPNLVWDPEAETGIGSTGLVEVRVLFNYAGDVVKASPLQRVQVVPHAFGGSFPTDAAGPGQVALFTGEIQMSQTDVSVPGYGGALSLGRSHLSMAGTPAGPAGVFGPGWKADLSGPDEGVGGFTVTDRTAVDGSITLSSPEGESSVYRHESGTAGAQEPGDYRGVGETALEEDSLKLVATTGGGGVSHRLTLTQWDGTKTIFVRTNGVWTTEKVIGTEDASTTSYAHDGDGSVSWIFAPAPSGVSCDPTSQQAGCRALHLNYTGTGTAKRLSSVDLRIYDPHPGADGLPGSGAGMETITVAEYSYDSAGQLAAAWDPRAGEGVAALKTQYTYSAIDGAGHTRLTEISEPGLKPWAFNYDGTHRLNTVTRAQDAAVGGAAATWTVRYGLALSGTGLPDLTPQSTATWGQPALDAPAGGAAVFGPDHPSADDYEYASLSYWTKSGRLTNSASFGAGKWQVESQRYDEMGNTIWSLDAAGRSQALAEGTTPEETAGAASKYAAFTVYNADGTRVEETYSPTRDFVLKDGTPFTGRTLTQTVYDAEPDASGYTDGRPTTDVPVGGFDLPVRGFTSATDAAGPGDGPSSENIGTPRPSRELDGEETRTYYNPISGDGDGWLLMTPTRVSTQDGSGWSTSSTRFDTEGKETETRTFESDASVGSASTARTMQTVYYTANNGASRDECDMKPQWAGQVCWHGTAGPPATGDPIPATTITGYSALLAPTKAVEASGAAIRNRVIAYDAAGRPATASLATSGLGTPDRAVPAVTTTYSPTTGAPTSMSSGTQTQTIGYDTWGRVTSQNDGTGSTATTSYDNAGRVATANDGKGTYTYTYNGLDSQQRKERRGLMTKLDVGLVSGPDEFTGAYNDSGALIEENYPGGIKATWTRALTGDTTGLTYSQGGTPLLAFSNSLDQSGRVREASGPGSERSYRYDDGDRLTKVEDTTGSACTTRVYDFSKDSNRKSLATHAPSTAVGSEGQCQTATAASTQTSSFDDADRIIGTGYTYDPLGRTKTVAASNTTTPLASPSNLAVSYHANDMVATLEQSGIEDGVAVSKSQDFSLDLTGRISAVRNLTDQSELEEGVNHYFAPGDDIPTWAETKSRSSAQDAWTASWTRYVNALNGDLGIVQTSAGLSSVQLSNLHGDVVGSVLVGDSGLDQYSEADEYGQQTPELPPRKYGWLGGKQRESGMLGGMVLMGMRVYNPVSGRFLSRDPIEGGTDNAYVYPPDPVNRSDLTGSREFCRYNVARNRFCSSAWRTLHESYGSYRVQNFSDAVKQFGSIKAAAFDALYGLLGRIAFGSPTKQRVVARTHLKVQKRWAPYNTKGLYVAVYRIRIRYEGQVQVRFHIYYWWRWLYGRYEWVAAPVRSKWDNTYYSYNPYGG